MSKYAIFNELNGENVHVGIVRARWNGDITHNLYTGAVATFSDYGVPHDHMRKREVPGSFELPWMTQSLINTHEVDVVLAIGCLIQGSTPHFEYLANAVSNGLTTVSLQTGVPVVFGVLTCLNEEQARERSEGSHNHGPEWAKTAIELGNMQTEFRS